MGGMTVLANHEAAPHVLSSVIVIAFASWQILRYLFFHPELTVYMLAMYPTKSWLTQHRYNERHPMDKPVFRWFQRVPEFYFYDNYRDFIKMGILANDPYVEYMKSIGRERDLTLYMDDKGWGEGARARSPTCSRTSGARRRSTEHGRRCRPVCGGKFWRRSGISSNKTVREIQLGKKK